MEAEAEAGEGVLPRGEVAVEGRQLCLLHSLGKEEKSE